MSFKNICFSFFLLLIMSLFIAGVCANSKNKDLPLLHKVIFIDPGHGGRDAGTSYGKILEKDINLEISLILREHLGEKGAIVYMTREEDKDLSSIYDKRKKRGDLYRRIMMISDKKVNTDMYLSIHINWYDNPYWGGAEVLYNNINPNNKVLAELLMEEFKLNLDTERTIKTTDLYMYKNLSVPGVLIECGFLSNYKERNLLQSSQYHHKISSSITNAVIKYFESGY